MSVAPVFVINEVADPSGNNNYADGANGVESNI